jgi:transcriptional regulator with XRE-family HTH domain
MPHAQSVDVILGRVLGATGLKTRKELAEKLGISPSAISNWRTKGEIPATTLEGILRTFGLSREYVLAGQGGPIAGEAGKGLPASPGPSFDPDPVEGDRHLKEVLAERQELPRPRMLLEAFIREVEGVAALRRISPAELAVRAFGDREESLSRWNEIRLAPDFLTAAEMVRLAYALEFSLGELMHKVEDSIRFARGRVGEPEQGYGISRVQERPGEYGGKEKS